jgi:heme/copper-type cytochrome/quinol oxidase subunit 2
VLLTVVYGVLVIGAVCLVALAGLELVQRLVPATSRQPHNDVAGFIYAALGVIYAVLLALVVIAVWEEYDAANVTVEQEANALAEIFWWAIGFLSLKVPTSRNSPDPTPRRWSTRSGPLWNREKLP